MFGTPIFGENGELSQVVACSLPIVSLSSLREDFEGFLREVNSLRGRRVNPTVSASAQSGMLDQYDSLKKIRTLIHRVAATDATILITGESGVGKEVVADEIYRLSARRDKPYVKLNCASIPAHLLESSCSVTSGVPSPGQTPRGRSACSSTPTAVPSCWTRSGICPWISR